jgi:hypothetical protein
MLRLTPCLILSQIPTKTIPGLFNILTEILVLNTKKSNYMLVKLGQLKTDTKNGIV